MAFLDRVAQLNAPTFPDVIGAAVAESDISPYLCHYCYANTNNATALANWNRHCQCPHAEAITGR